MKIYVHRKLSKQQYFKIYLRKKTHYLTKYLFACIYNNLISNKHTVFGLPTKDTLFKITDKVLNRKISAYQIVTSILKFYLETLEIHYIYYLKLFYIKKQYLKLKIDVYLKCYSNTISILSKLNFIQEVT